MKLFYLSVVLLGFMLLIGLIRTFLLKRQLILHKDLIETLREETKKQNQEIMELREWMNKKQEQ